jgi:hypothetical protein
MSNMGKDPPGYGKCSLRKRVVRTEGRKPGRAEREKKIFKLGIIL